MSKDYERLAASSEAFIYVAMTRLMVWRLARGCSANLVLTAFSEVRYPHATPK
jgi:hypothetical protein